MKKFLLTLVMILAAVAASVVPASAATRAPAANTTFSNLKILGWDDGCLTYSHPVSGAAVGVTPCQYAHTFDIVITADQLHFILKVHGANLAIGDSGGRPAIKPYNTVTDVFVVPANSSPMKGLVQFQAFEFQNTTIFMEQHGTQGPVTLTHVKTVHDCYRAIE